jgi:putative addiction module killer protein
MAAVIRVDHYQMASGRFPFKEWIEALKDKKSRFVIDRRIARISLGNQGDYRSVGGGVSEMRIHFGPGFRVYFLIDGAKVVVLLCGGDKRSQGRDIKAARQYAEDYWERHEK